MQNLRIVAPVILGLLTIAIAPKANAVPEINSIPEGLIANILTRSLSKLLKVSLHIQGFLNEYKESNLWELMAQ